MKAIRVIGVPTYNTYTTLNLKSNNNNYEGQEETASPQCSCEFKGGEILEKENENKDHMYIII